MKDNIYIKDNKLVIEKSLRDVVGLIHTNAVGSEEMGFSYEIDMSYKGKPNQVSSFFFIVDDLDVEEFRELCEELGFCIFETYDIR